MRQAPTARPERGAEERPLAFGGMALLRLLSRNDRAEVHVAVRPEGIDRLCVANLFVPSYTARTEVLEAARAQADWLVSRVHGNLVQTYDVAQVEGRLVVVNEFVEGRDLAALLLAAAGRPGGLPLEAALYVALEVAAALEFIRTHEHQATGIETALADLTAASVVVARDGAIKVIHHGSALAPSGGVAAAGAPFLIPREESREEFNAGMSGSEAPDVYAVGALLRQMLGAVVAPAPPALEALVTSACARRAADRPGTVDALRVQIVRAAKVAGGDGRIALAELLGELFGAAMSAEGVELAQLSAAAERELISTGSRSVPATLTNFDPVALARAPSRPTTKLPLGQVIPGTRYRALKKLGEGGMGAVYAAEHVDIERKVAIKIVHAELLRNPVVLRQFRQEARAASRIGNPYICDVTDWGELPDGRVFFVMEYLDGASLGRALKLKRRLPPARAIPILRQVAKALGAAHDKGIVHLDVKPDNVLLLQRDGRADAVKVVDFGVAGILGQMQTGSQAKVMGTPEYMAPERALGRGYDHRSDIYSLGVMAFEMLVGEVPLQGSSPIDTLVAQVSESPDRINERLTSRVPEALDAAVQKLMYKDPARRPQSMADVEALLLEAQLDARIRTPWDDLALPVMTPERAGRVRRRLEWSVSRMRLFTIAAATVAVLGTVTTAALALRGSRVLDATSNTKQGAGKAGGAAAGPARAVRAGGVVIVPSSPGRAVVASQSLAASPASLAATRATDRRAGARDDVATVQERNQERNQDRRDQATARQAVVRGAAAFTAGSIEQAKAEFERAAAEDPRNPAALGGLAEVAFELARYADAVHFAGRAARLAPRAARHLVVLGDASFKLGRYADALRAYQRARVLAPGDPAIAAGLERVTAKLGATARP